MQRTAIATILATILSTLTMHASAQPAVTLVGFVADESGRPLGGAMVEAYREGSLLGSTTSLPNGYFHLPIPMAGACEVVVYKRGYEQKIIRLFIAGTGVVNVGNISLGYALKLGLEATYVVVDQGSSIEMHLSVANAGAYAELITLLVKAPPKWDVQLIAAQNLAVRNLVLAPGESRVLKVRIQVPYDARGLAPISLIFSYANVTQSLQLLVEARERTWELITLYFPAVTSFPGGRFTVPLRVRNPLSVPAVVNISVRAPEGWAASVLLNESRASLIRLDPGDIVAARLVVSVPEYARPGRYTIVLEARALDVVTSSNLTVDVEPLYDLLRVETSSPFIRAPPGGQAAIPLTITNEGTRAAIARFRVTGLPAGYGWSLKDEYGNVISAALVPPRGSRSVQLVVDIPESSPPTVVSFRLEVVGLNSTSSVELSIDVAGRPSLKVLTQNWEVEVASGSSTLFQVLVENDGEIPLQEVSVELIDGGLQGLSISVDPPRVTGLQPKARAVFTLSISVSNEVATGRYLVPITIRLPDARYSYTLAINVRAGGERFYVATSLLVLALVVAAYLAVARRGRWGG